MPRDEVHRHRASPLARTAGIRSQVGGDQFGEHPLQVLVHDCLPRHLDRRVTAPPVPFDVLEDGEG